MSVLRKLATVALIVLALGVPMLETWRSLLFACAVLVVVFGAARDGWRPFATAVLVVAAAMTVATMLPRADIAEAHNAFLITGPGEALERGLPAAVFRNWRAQFDALYPPDLRPPAVATWRAAGPPPSVYTASSDAIWRAAKYTRQVDAITFRNIGDFRGGFANDLQYNFWTGELLREQMPFYVMYELTPASVGSRFEWKGQVFWQRSDGEYDEIVHPEIASREIAAGDAGRKIYAAFFPKRDAALYFSLTPGWTLRLSAWMSATLSMLAALAVLFLMIRPRWRACGRALALFAVGYAYIAAFLLISAGKYLGKPYPPQGGGDDGLANDGWGRSMAMLAGRGRVVEALKGFEPVYWFTPGTRYVRMLEKLIFGDTNHLFALITACIPIVVFHLARHFVGARRAWLMLALFAMVPVGSFSYLQYVMNAKLGYGETVGCGLFFIGLVLLLRSESAWGGTDRNLVMVWIAGAALSASVFIRPNFVFAVVWLGLAFVWTSLRAGDVRRAVIVLTGLAVAAVWMPLHNWYYGHEFYLISKSGSTFNTPLRPADYAIAVFDLLRGRIHSHEVAVTSTQTVGWLLDLGLVSREALVPLARVAQGVRLFGLAMTVWVAARWVGRGRVENDFGVLAVAAIAAHLPMLFINSTYARYDMLGWELSMFVLVIWMARRRPSRVARTVNAPQPTWDAAG